MENILKQLRDATGVQLINATGLAAPLAALPPNYSLHDLEGYLEKPNTIRQEIQFADTESLAAYANEHTTEQTRVYAEQNKGIKIIFDDHTPGQPNNREHEARLLFKHTQEFRKWHGINNNHMSQEQFIEFIEDNSGDVVEPVAADILKLAENLRVMQASEVASRIDRGTGGYQVEFRNKEGLAENCIFPAQITIGTLIYEHERDDEDAKRYPIVFRLRVKVRDKKITITLINNNLDLIIKKAFKEAVSNVTKMLPQTPLYNL